MYTNIIYVLVLEKEWKKLTVEIDVEMNQQFAFMSRNGGGNGMKFDDVTLVPGPCDIPGSNLTYPNFISQVHFCPNCISQVHFCPLY